MSAPVEGKIQLPVAGERNVLITSALPYVNNVPHLGNIVGCVLSGDVYARFCRLRGYNTLYICGTDEYGTATETKAQQEGLTPQQICDKYHVIHKAVYDWFDIAFDHFGRTSTPTQTAIAQDIFKKCDANKFICCQKTQQFYCTPCDRFLADRFVSGVCPFCKYEDAKGDQCDKCSKLINAIELTNPLCTVCKAAPQVKDSKQLCLTLPKLQCKLKNFVKQNYGPWSANARQVTDAWLAQKLIARQITRDLKWGTPVPKPGFDSKVFYVWFDAPIGYISITAGYSDQWQKWWKWDRADGAEHKPAADCADTACEECEEPAAGPEAGAEGADDKDAKLYKDCEGCAECDDAAKPEFVDKYNVELVQFLGKDNIPFHSVMFPSTLLAAKDGYIMPRTISSTEYLNYEGAKFSKTRGVGVFGDQARDTGVPSEVWRYYLLANRPEQADTMFTWDDFASKANSELPNNLGNLVQRVLAFISSKLGGVVPAAVSSKLGDAETQLETEVADLMQNYVKLLDTQSLKDALRTAMNISMAGNKYMQDKKPWALTEDAEACGTALAVLTQLIYLLAIILDPFMPGFSRKVFAQLNLTMPTTPLKNIEAGMEGSAWPLAKILAAAAAAAQNPEAAVVPGLIVVPAGHKLGAPAPIFGKLDAGRVTELRQKFQVRTHTPIFHVILSVWYGCNVLFFFFSSCFISSYPLYCFCCSFCRVL